VAFLQKKVQDLQISNKSLEESQVISVCGLSRRTVAEDHDGVCPCGRSLVLHPKGPDAQSSTAAVIETSAASSVSAKSFGISTELFATHPVSFDAARWRSILSAIRGKSDSDRKLEHTLKKRDRKAVAADKSTTKQDDEVALRQLVMESDLPGGRLQEFAGLLAAMTALASYNKVSTTPITVDRSALAEGDSGVIPAQHAIGDAAVSRLHREGRVYFCGLFATLRDEHRGDAIHYVKIDEAKGKRKTVSWPDQFSRTLFRSYKQFLLRRPPTWRPAGLHEYLAREWTIPTRNTIMPLDLTPMLVQTGALALLAATEHFEVIGDSLDAVEAHVRAAFEIFQSKVILTPANMAEYKRYLSEADLQHKQTAGTSGGRGANGGRNGGMSAFGGRNGGRGRTGGNGFTNGRGGAPMSLTSLTSLVGTGPPSIHPGSSVSQFPPYNPTRAPGNHSVASFGGNSPPAGAVPAGTVQAARHLPPGQPVYLRCIVPNCSSRPPPAGFALGPYCRNHNPNYQGTQHSHAGGGGGGHGDGGQHRATG
jgi:uncharacterized membrane protein YgcG